MESFEIGEEVTWKMIQFDDLQKNLVRDIVTFLEQPLQYGGCISDFQNHCCNLISKKEVAAAILKITNTTSIL